MNRKNMIDQVEAGKFIKDASLLDLVCLNTLLGKMHPINQPTRMTSAIDREIQARYKVTQDAKNLQRYIGK